MRAAGNDGADAPICVGVNAWPIRIASIWSSEVPNGIVPGAPIGGGQVDACLDVKVEVDRVSRWEGDAGAVVYAPKDHVCNGLTDCVAIGCALGCRPVIDVGRNRDRHY